MSYYGYWGKWGGDPVKAHLLAYHSLDVAATFQAYLDANPDQTKSLLLGLGDPIVATRWLLWLVGLHDIGKFSPTFQNMVPEAVSQVRGVVHLDGPVSARHDEIGVVALEELGLLAELGSDLRHLVYASMGHHGYPVGGGGQDLSHHLRQVLPVSVRADLRSFAEETRGLFEVPAGWLGFDRKVATGLSFAVAGLVVLADWIGSNEGFFPRRTDVIPLKDYWDVARDQARAALIATGVLRGRPKSLMAFGEQFESLGPPTPLQVAAGDVSLSPEGGPQVFIFESITGDGKTEAAMRLTHRLMAAGMADGFYLALPTMATSNAMYERLKGDLAGLYEDSSRVSCVLAHAGRNLHSEFRSSLLDMHSAESRPWRRGGVTEAPTAGARCNAWLADNAKKALLSQCGVGTIDQAMLAVMKAKHQSLRLLGLHRKVLIVDEVHANDTYMHAVIQRLMEFHAASGGSAILLSATLPMWMRQDLVSAFRRGLEQDPLPLTDGRSYPLITRAGKGPILEQPVGLVHGRSRSVKVLRVGSAEDAVEVLLAAAKRGECACWVRNTVGEAMEAFSLVRSEMAQAGLSPQDVMLFHARFAMGDRLAIEGEVTRLFGKDSNSGLRAGRILVATQVVEQSLDIDFDVMVTDMAPVDLVIQRAGRLRRHRRLASGDLTADGGLDERGEAVLYLHGPDPLVEALGKDWVRSFSAGTAVVYPDHAVLWRGLSLLLGQGGFHMPEDARDLIERTFGDRPIPAPASLLDSERRVETKASRDEGFAMQNLLTRASGYCASQVWADDGSVPTRLGEASTTIRLVCWDGQRLAPWGYTGPRPANFMDWALCEVRVRRNSLCTPSLPSGQAAREALATLLEALPDHGEWFPVMVLSRSVNGGWEGAAADGDGCLQVWRYDASLGLSKAV